MNHEHIFVHWSLVLFENKHRLNTIKLATGNVCVCVHCDDGISFRVDRRTQVLQV